MLDSARCEYCNLLFLNVDPALFDNDPGITKASLANHNCPLKFGGSVYQIEPRSIDKELEYLGLQVRVLQAQGYIVTGFGDITRDNYGQLSRTITFQKAKEIDK